MPSSPTRPVMCVAFSPAGKFVASGGADNQVFVWKTNVDAVDQRIAGE